MGSTVRPQPPLTPPPQPCSCYAPAPQVRYFCNAMPWVECTQLRYHCTKVPDVDLCPQAFAGGCALRAARPEEAGPRRPRPARLDPTRLDPPAAAGPGRCNVLLWAWSPPSPSACCSAALWAAAAGSEGCSKSPPPPRLPLSLPLSSRRGPLPAGLHCQGLCPAGGHAGAARPQRLDRPGDPAAAGGWVACGGERAGKWAGALPGKVYAQCSGGPACASEAWSELLALQRAGGWTAWSHCSQKRWPGALDEVHASI